MHLGAPAALLFALQDYSPAATPISSSDTIWLWIALAVGVLALLVALLIARSVIAGDTGTPDMRAISDAIREGAEAFLARQYRTIGIIAVVLAVIVFLGYHASPRTAPLVVVTTPDGSFTSTVNLARGVELVSRLTQ